ncbi:hypothetical protein QF042_002459 [Pedobacter sp. W3I1]|uniref:MarR family transcriptional regulator n=1 Tax=Pedobacter sp. W3I1 TaxID=3042291 RepID=UPI002787DF43|nr:helix-turn-helix domain-containing protein [Pedobacter sp. W3I1]MDQ0638894.1 hypothetical protein [Pedobacter sp. W3I1]
MNQKQLPIGYYLKLADSCLTKGIDGIQSKHGLNRMEWQVLNSIYEKPEILISEIIELMDPIADDQLVGAILTKFINRKQLEVNNTDMLTLTVDGRNYTNLAFRLNWRLEKKRLWISRTQITKPQYQRFKK